ncbi:hypothetical protein [Emticicia sp.]|uniref:hypothetical protein n=1 Tax=Emticicia sp. TaxID=1930953 RepID=UPI0037505D8D
MVSYRPFDEVIDFIISSPDPQKVLDFRPSSTLQDRVEDLVYKKKTSELNLDEIAELERYLLIDHIMIMAKKRAKKSLSG